MKKIELLLFSSVLLLFFISCTPQKGMSQRVIHARNMSIPSVYYSMDSSIYMCVQYTLSYPKKHNSRRYKKREVCSCHKSLNLNHLIEWEKNYYSHPSTYGANTLIIWDKDFIVNHVLPLIRKDIDRRVIEYALVHNDDTTFRNIIDYDNKVIINEKMYYYPMKVKTYISILTVDYEWFKTIVPQSSWIYKPDCFDDGKGMYVNLLIPL